MILWWTIISSSKLTLGEKLIFFAGYFLSISILSWIIIILVLINVVFIFSYIKKKRRLLKEGSVVGSLGLAFGVIGGGCIACGTAILGILGFGGALAFLPFGGGELLWISIFLLILSIYLLNKGLKEKNICDT